jgi:DNA-binding protein WhiA
LSLIGAHQALLYFEDVRIVKDMRNSVNRLHNCEIANINKTVNAAARQMENIQADSTRRSGLENLPKRLREVAELRVDAPRYQSEGAGGNDARAESCQQIGNQSPLAKN